MTPPSKESNAPTSTDAPVISPTPLYDRWLKNPDNAVELAKVLSLPLVSEAIMVLREIGVPRRVAKPQVGEAGDGAKERAAAGLYEIQGYHAALDNLFMLTSTAAQKTKLSEEWRGPSIRERVDRELRISSKNEPA